MLLVPPWAHHLNITSLDNLWSKHVVGHMSDLPQSFLKPISVYEAVKSGVQVRFGHEYVSHIDHGDRVEVTLRERERTREYNVLCNYLIGADDARSLVIEALGIPIIGRTINSAFNVHIQADLSKYMKHRPGSLNWILNTEAPHWSAVGNFRMVRPWNEYNFSAVKYCSNTNCLGQMSGLCRCTRHKRTVLSLTLGRADHRAFASIASVRSNSRAR